jgi:hypothetical protein
MVAVVAQDLLHGHVHVMANTGRFGAAVFVYDRKLVAVAEIDETLPIAVEMQIDATVLIQIIGFRRGVGIRKPEPARMFWMTSGRRRRRAAVRRKTPAGGILGSVG